MEKKSAINLLDQICSATFTRHAFSSQEDFLKDIHKENYEDENKAVRESKLALMVGCMEKVLEAKTQYDMLIAKMKLIAKL